VKYKNRFAIPNKKRNQILRKEKHFTLFR